MSEDRRALIRSTFDQAVELPPEERPAFLEQAIPDDPELRTEVQWLLLKDALLQAGHTTNTFLKSPVARSAVDSGPADHIGRYRILGLLGEGGMGAVYEAEQDNPRRRVALKVIRPGLGLPGMVKRFSQEAQILGRLQHPGIAQVYEAGVAGDGRPFFAMEFIRGVPLDRHARDHNLAPAARLSLLAQVADAVQHAHDKGVIHRDLKPGNILVNESGQPKVLDFGVARMTDVDLQSTAGRTVVGEIIGTLNFMSPEQIEADPSRLDGRADVYALGVILFALLTDRLPHNLDGLPLPEVARVIRDQEPLSLSSINARWRGDVQTIVAKALEKDRARRYSSAGELAADIRRYLNNEAIRARPASAIYRIRKFGRRHKELVVGMAAVVLVLILGLIGTTLFALRADRNAGRADRETREALDQTYRARLAAAVAALQNHDVADAARQLNQAPGDRRDWEWFHLRSRLDDSSARIRAPRGSRLWLLPGPDGIQVGLDSPTRLDLMGLDGKLVRSIPLPISPESMGHVASTPHGIRFVNWGPGNALCTWDESGKRCDVGTVPASIVRIGPDGKTVAVCVSRNGLGFSLFSNSERTPPTYCIGHTEPILDLAFSHDGRQIATASEDGLVCIWNAKSGAKTICRGHTSKVISVAFRGDGRRLVSTSADGTVRQWNPETGAEVEPAFERHSGEVLAATYSPDGEWIASGGVDRSIRVWRATGRQESAVVHGHTGAVYRLLFTPDGRRIVSLSQKGGYGWAGDDSVGVWDVSYPSVLLGHDSYVYPVEWSRDGRWIASGSWDRTVRIWDAETRQVHAVLDNKDLVKTLAFSPDGSRIVTARPDAFQVWDVASGRRLVEFPTPGPSIQAIAFHPDGATFAAIEISGIGTIHDAETGREVARIPLGATHDSKALAYSPDGRWLAGTSPDLKSVYLYDARTYQLAAQWAGHDDAIRVVAFSADSRRLASAGVDRTIRVWDVATGTCDVLTGHTDEVFALAFHPRGTRLASAGRDQAVWLWNLTRCEEVARLQGHTSYVWSLAFSPDGRTLISGSGDKTVRRWDTAPRP